MTDAHGGPQEVDDADGPAIGDYGVVGVGHYAAVAELRLDARNPRFPVDVDSTDQRAIAIAIANKYDALEIARNIAREGFHAAEPPAVIRNEDGSFTVLEGNRRVTALMGLADPTLRAEFADTTQWQAAAVLGNDEGRIASTIPVIVYESRAAAAPLLGARHIRGPKKWEPMQQDRYVCDLVAGGATFADSADICGITLGDVKKAYRNYRLISINAPTLKLDTSRAAGKYSVLELVWDNKALREHAKVAAISDVVPSGSSIAAGVDDEAAKASLGEVLKWVLGDSATPPVLSESRKVLKLGQVVATGVGLEALRNGHTLDEALQLVADEGAAPLDAATRMLTSAGNSLRRAVAQIELLEPEEKAGLTDLVSAIEESLRAANAGLATPSTEA